MRSFTKLVIVVAAHVDTTYTGTPVAAMAAAAWSCVEKMLQLDHVTSAPSAVRVSIRTAVWIAVQMC